MFDPVVLYNDGWWEGMLKEAVEKVDVAVSGRVDGSAVVGLPWEEEDVDAPSLNSAPPPPPPPAAAVVISS